MPAESSLGVGSVLMQDSCSRVPSLYEELFVCVPRALQCQAVSVFRQDSEKSQGKEGMTGLEHQADRVWGLRTPPLAMWEEQQLPKPSALNQGGRCKGRFICLT